MVRCWLVFFFPGIWAGPAFDESCELCFCLILFVFLFLFLFKIHAIASRSTHRWFCYLISLLRLQGAGALCKRVVCVCVNLCVSVSVLFLD